MLYSICIGLWFICSYGACMASTHMEYSAVEFLYRVQHVRTTAFQTASFTVHAHSEYNIPVLKYSAIISDTFIKCGLTYGGCACW